MPEWHAGGFPLTTAVCQLVNANAAGNQTRRDNDPARLTRDMRRVMGPVSSPMLLLCCESFPMLELAR
jgi:hypothetical protein